MNKKLMTFLLVLSLPLTTYALSPQPGNPAAPEKPQRVERLAKELGLSESQKGQVEAIFSEEKLKFKALKEKKRTRLQGVLTKEQMAKFDLLHQQRHHNYPDNGKGG
jgi:periplasmic protein CpxP/Spy